MGYLLIPSYQIYKSTNPPPLSIPFPHIRVGNFPPHFSTTNFSTCFKSRPLSLSQESSTIIFFFFLFYNQPFPSSSICIPFKHILVSVKNKKILPDPFLTFVSTFLHLHHNQTSWVVYTQHLHFPRSLPLCSTLKMMLSLPYCPKTILSKVTNVHCSHISQLFQQKCYVAQWLTTKTFIFCSCLFSWAEVQLRRVSLELIQDICLVQVYSICLLFWRNQMIFRAYSHGDGRCRKEMNKNMLCLYGQGSELSISFFHSHVIGQSKSCPGPISVGQKVYFTLVEVQNHVGKNMSTERGKELGKTLNLP